MRSFVSPFFIRFGWALMCLLAPIAQAASELEVAASILPVHSLVSAVSVGVLTPTLILPGNASPHVHQLRPSQARALHRADVVFLVGPQLETFLMRSILSLSENAQVSHLMWTPGVSHLPIGRYGTYPHVEELGTGEGDSHKQDLHTLDSHIWLSPSNASRMVIEIARILGEADTENQQRYQDNAKALLVKIATMDREINSLLSSIRERPFVVFHDAYGYFEAHYELSVLGSLSVNANQPPSAKRVAELKENILANGGVCVFFEPQYNVSWAQALGNNAHLRVGTLDPLGAMLEPGPQAYFELMHQLANALVACLDD